MKKALITAILALASAAHAEPWTKTQKTLQTAWYAANTVDWIQTRALSKQCKTGRIYESNWILGRCPTLKNVDQYFALSYPIHTLIAHRLSKDWRTVFISMSLGMTSHAVNINFNIGLK